FGNVDYGLQVLGGRTDRGPSGSCIAADKLASTIHDHFAACRALESGSVARTALSGRKEREMRRARPRQSGSSSRHARGARRSVPPEPAASAQAFRTARPPVDNWGGLPM